MASDSRRQSDRGRVDFRLNAESHFAAVDHLRRRHKGNRFKRLGISVAVALVLIGALWVIEGGLTFEHARQLTLFLAAFSVLGALAWVALMSWPVRRFLFRRASTVRCTLEFDGGGITVEIGKSPLRYPWSKVDSVAEDAEYLFVLARSSACFAIPKTAFASPVEAENFAAGMRRFLVP